MIKSIIKEYGSLWVMNRALYTFKLKMLRIFPMSERLFETEVNIKRINIFNINVDSIEKFLCNLSNEQKEEIISVADKAIEGKILGFSSVQLDYGDPINWHYNPITKKTVDKNIKWYKIPDFDPERGDIKAIWESSRFTHFFYFTRAYMITKDSKYFRAFSAQISSWLQENKYSYGSNYKCGQEATLRMINCLMAYNIFNHYNLITQEDQLNVEDIVKGSYKKVLSNFFYAHKCIKNNHTLSEITGLIIGSWACKDDKKLIQAYSLLDKEIKNQFFSDGGYKQYSFNYQRFALQIIECIMQISNQTNITISNESKELIKKSAYLIYKMQNETGDVPNYGSNDGALIFPVTCCGYRDFRPVVNTIISILEGKRVYKSGCYDEEILWFSDNKLQELPITVLDKTDESFNESGFYVLRQKSTSLMVVLQEFKTRPAQMDQLHLDLWHKNVNIFCDSGTYSYATDIGKELSMTSAHNTVKVQGIEQMKKQGPFLIYDWSRRGDLIHSDGVFKGTMMSKNGYNHTRNIEKISNGYMIKDQVFSDKGEYCEFYFHTPCQVQSTNNGLNLYHKGQLLGKIETDKKVEIKDVYRSLYYLRKEKINRVSIKVELTNGKSEANTRILLMD